MVMTREGRPLFKADQVGAGAILAPDGGRADTRDPDVDELVVCTGNVC